MNDNREFSKRDDDGRSHLTSLKSERNGEGIWISRGMARVDVFRRIS